MAANIKTNLGGCENRWVNTQREQYTKSIPSFIHYATEIHSGTSTFAPWGMDEVRGGMQGGDKGTRSGQ